MRLTELRELAERATPGPWEVGATKEHGVFTVADVPFGPEAIAAATDRLENATYIAACSPEVVQALLAVAEAAEAVLDSRTMKARIAALRRLEDALDALKAALA